jgi:hypothetical protein
VKAIGYFKETPGVSKTSGQEQIATFCTGSGHELVECHSEKVAGRALAQCLANLNRETPLFICLNWSDLLQGDVHDQHSVLMKFIGNTYRHQLILINDAVDTTTEEGYNAVLNGMWQEVYHAHQYAIAKRNQ